MHRNAIRTGLSPNLHALAVGGDFILKTATSDHSVRGQVCRVQKLTGAKFTVAETGRNREGSTFIIRRIA